MHEDRVRRDAEALAREIVGRVGPHIRLALPLGLGKAVTVANALTHLAEKDSAIRLDIFTALTLERPQPTSDLQRRFLEPAMDRLFGAYPTIRYAELLRQNALPPNIAVREFFFMAGNWLGNAAAQSAYITANYTLAFDYLLERQPNVIAQLMARQCGGLSLSCNTDITVDLLRARRAGDAAFLMVGEVNPELPFMGGTGAVVPEEVDLLLDDPDTAFELFSAVKRPISLADHAIGLHVARLVPDGGTLQLGIGQIGDAVASALLMRHREPEVAAAIWQDCPFPQDKRFREIGCFDNGLYVVTEMLVEGILELFDAGIVRREVDGACIHAGFFLDCRTFYRRLRDMPEADRARISMMPVSFTNQLYGDEDAKRAARRDARFVNSAMKVTALGAAISDATEKGETVSGVGGQYDFVAQAHALKTARSVIVLNATRTRKGKAGSNIVWDHPHETIPRHLRDVVVTEYGIADLRGKSDEDAILAMIAFADSRFQDGLLDRAKSSGKVRPDAELPPDSLTNTPQRLADWLSGPHRRGALVDFPFGTDFSGIEQRLLPALTLLNEISGSAPGMTRLAIKGITARPSEAESQCLERLALRNGGGVSARLTRWLVLGALRRSGPVRQSGSE